MKYGSAPALLLVGIVCGLVLSRTVLPGQVSAEPTTPKVTASYRDVVKKVLPAVVNIEAKEKRNLRRDQQPGEAPNLGVGSGFIVDAQGVVLTNYHVVEGAEEVVVSLMDGRKFTTKDIKSDAKTDLAVIRFTTTEKLPVLELGDSDAMEIGDHVLAVGAPFGLTGSVTHGIVSGKDRSLRMNMYEDFIQTDAAINPGNSGGPLVNLEGKVIGITSAIKTRSGGFQGVGLAISSKLTKTIMKKLLEEGVVRRGYLGVQVKDIPDAAFAERLGLKEGQTGVVVSLLYEGAPGEKAGLKEGDVILSLNDKPIRDSRGLQNIVAGLPLNKPVQLSILREGKAQSLSVTIEEQPLKFGTRP